MCSVGECRKFCASFPDVKCLRGTERGHALIHAWRVSLNELHLKRYLCFRTISAPTKRFFRMDVGSVQLLTNELSRVLRHRAAPRGMRAAHKRDQVVCESSLQ